MVEHLPFKQRCSGSSPDGGTLYGYQPTTIKKCRELRNKGLTLGEIVKKTSVPKTTVHDHVKDIPLSEKTKERIRKEAIIRLKKFCPMKKGKCAPGRIVLKPKTWTNDLIFLIAHFMFDGEISNGGCIYNNRSKALVNQVELLMKKIFGLKEPRRLFNKITGVYRISYFYIELKIYAEKKANELKKYIKRASLPEKRIFLKSFFDDEGNINIHKNNRRVRGYQHNLRILKLIQTLLRDFDIESKISKKYGELVIRRKENLIKFRDEINFSKGIYINPERKNSIWKQKLEKREILNIAINSYQS